MYKTRQVQVGPYILGTGNPVRVQSMCNTDTMQQRQPRKLICWRMPAVKLTA